MRQRRMRFGHAAGLGDQPIRSLHQVHGTAVLRCTDLVEDVEGAEAVGDGLVSLRGDRPRRALSVMTADCVPLVLAERNGQAVAAIHAGWRGTAGGIAAEAVQTLSQLGCRPDDLLAALGPAIGGCCYTVETDLAAVVARSAGVAESEIARPCGDGKVLLDLRRVNRLQLLGAGVPENAIFIAPWCTRCAKGLFFSYRREGSRAGRMLTGVGWSPRSHPASQAVP
jgi:YfiH family protein